MKTRTMLHVLLLKPCQKTGGSYPLFDSIMYRAAETKAL